MNFGNVNKQVCLNLPPQADIRCQDLAFRTLNPSVCPAVPFLVIKPSIALACVLGSIQFKAFLNSGGVELDVTDDTIFTTSNSDVAVVGAISGNATGISAGTANISGTYGSYTAQAELDILGGACCDDLTIASMLIIDTSKSMSLAFNSSYTSRLAYAKAAAHRYISGVNESKDLVGLVSFNAAESVVLSDPTSDKSSVDTLVSGLVQTSQSTTFFDGLSAALTSLNDSGADRKIIVLISDGEEQSASYTDSNNPFQLLQDFKTAGGIVICLGVRAHDKGYNILSTFSTGGFFINAYNATAVTALDYLAGLKGYLCDGNCAPVGDVYQASGTLDYDGFENWTVDGHVDLLGNGFFDLLPDNGLYVDLAGSTAAFNGEMVSTDEYSLVDAHNYRVTLALAGNQRTNISQKVLLSLYDSTNTVIFSTAVVINDFTQSFQDYAFNFTAPHDVDVRISIQLETPVTGDEATGILLNSVKLEDTTDLTLMFFDDFENENLQYIPPRCGMGTVLVAYGSSSETANLVPTMTGNTSPSGTASASVQNSDAWKAFDDDDSTQWYSNVSDDGPALLNYQFTAAKSVSSYRVKMVCDVNVDWTLEGSSNGSVWQVLDTQTNKDDLDETFSLSVVSTYQYFRLNIDKNLGNGVAIFTFELIGSVCETNQVPLMTSDSTPSGVASAISTSPFNAYVIFDRDDVTGWLGNFDNPSWIQYQFPSPTTISKYRIKFGSGEMDLLTLQGSNDGASWTIIDSQVNPTAGGGDVDISPTLSSEQTWSYYRVEFTFNSIDSSNIIVYSIELILALPCIGYGYMTGYNCYGEGCLSTPPPAQLSDPNPLGDVEAGYSPPRLYSSTKTVCATCDDGFVNVSASNLVPEMTSDTAPSGEASASFGSGAAWYAFTSSPPTSAGFQVQTNAPIWLQYKSAAAVTITSYSITTFGALNGINNWIFQGSTDGATWVDLDTQAGISWFNGEEKIFQITNATAYQYHRLYVSVGGGDVAGGHYIQITRFKLFGSAATQVCKTESATSEISQADADAKANAAALAAGNAELNCVQQFSSTQSVTATCEPFEFGQPVTKTETRTSLVSISEAEAAATAAASALAEAALVCSLSNNESQIVINDSVGGELRKATAYPSIKNVTGYGVGVTITKVTVTITGFSHTSSDDVRILLRSPAGTYVEIMRNCGGVNASSNLNFVFDDAAGSALSDAGALSSGTYKTSLYGVQATYPVPATANPYGIVLADFIGESPNGQWAILVVDDSPSDVGTISSWNLTIST